MFFLGCLCMIWGAMERGASPPRRGAEGPQQLTADGRATLKAYINAAQLPDLHYLNFQDYRTEAEEFYESMGETLPWVRERRASPQAQALINLFKRADDEGLNPADYDVPRWDDRLPTIDSGRSSESELVRFDLAVTISTMRYVSDLHRGRVNPREFHFDLDIENKKIDLSEFLRQRLVFAENVTTVMRTVEPPFPAYRQTLDALKTYMKLAREDDGEPLPLPLKSIKPGDSPPRRYAENWPSYHA
jgi:L,D-transpeptidase YcbB